MRRRRPQPLLFLAFIVLMGALMYAKNRSVPEPSMGLKVAAGRLKVYYRETPPPNGWTIAEIAPRDGEVWVDLAVTGTQAAALAEGPRERMVEALLRQCPPKSDKAWSVLLNTQDIEVRGLGADGKPLAAVSCRAVH